MTTMTTWPDHKQRFFFPTMCSAIMACLLTATPTWGLEVEERGVVLLQGPIAANDDLSAAAITGDILLLGSDEHSSLEVLRKTGDDVYRTHTRINLLPDAKAEADIEAIATSGNVVYAVGSHSLVRKKVEYPHDRDQRTRAKNRSRLTEIKHEPARDHLFRFRLSKAGVPIAGIESISLRTILESDSVLSTFASVPGKEGGVDIEGLAVEGTTLWIGFRGPVLRQNYVPVLKLQFDQPKKYELLYVNLNGYGIRDMLKVSSGFLLLAGPVGDRNSPCEIYHWNGEDCVPGTDHLPAQITSLGEVPPSTNGNAEAIAIMTESATHWTLLTVYDGAPLGDPRKLQVTKP